jgi:hypothetical protein
LACFEVIRRKFRDRVNKNLHWLKLKYTDVKKLAMPNLSHNVSSSCLKPAAAIADGCAAESNEEPKKDQ